MNALTLKQLVQADLDQDKNIVCAVESSTMKVELMEFKSKFIKAFFEIFEDHVSCLSFVKGKYMDLYLDENDAQDAAFLKVGYVSPWQNLQGMFSEPNPNWDTVIPAGRESEILDLFIKESVGKIKEQLVS